MMLVFDDEDCVGHEPGDVHTQAFQVFSGFLVDRPVCAEDDWHSASAAGLHLGQSSWRRSWAARCLHLWLDLYQGGTGRLLVGAGVLNPCLLFVYNSPLLARCNVVMKPVPDCVVSRDAVELGMCAALHAVLMHSGTT